jgi:hypothetical protein
LNKINTKKLILLVERKISSILPDKEYDNVFAILTEDDLALTKKLAGISTSTERTLAEVFICKTSKKTGKTFIT